MRVCPFVLCLPLLTAASGCGFVFTRGPPTGHEHLAYVSCTESHTGPILDVIWGGLHVASAVLTATSPDEHPNPGFAVAGQVGWGALLGFSAASGFKKASACKSARQAWAQRQAARGVAQVPVGDSTIVMAVFITPGVDTLAAGAKRQFVAAAHNASGARLAGRMFTWSSSNDAIASVSNAGLVTAHAPGAVIIAANTTNVVGTATIVVRP